jgi:hypothetical protein
MATSAARKVARRWREDYEDVRQEMLLAALSGGLDLAWMDDPDLEEEEWKDLTRQTKTFLHYAGERYCRREKAAREGYQVEDEAFYSRARLQQLLEWYLESGLEAHPPVGRAESVSRPTGDPAEGGSHLASLLDVERGLGLIPPHYRERLEVRFGPLSGLSDDKIADLSQSEIRALTGWHHERLNRVLGTTGDQVRHRTDTALRQLLRTLGDVNPWNRGPIPKRVFRNEAA